MNKRTVELSFFYILSLAVIVFLFLIFKPFISSLFLAIVFATVFYPLHKWINKKFKDKKSISALVSTFAIILLIIIPLLIILSFLLQEVVSLYNSVSSDGFSSLTNYLKSFNSLIQKIIPTFDFNAIEINKSVQALLSWVVENTSTIFSSVLTLTLNTFIFLIALFYFFKDGENYIDTLIKVSPLPDSHDKTIVTKISTSFNSIVKGNLITAMIQGFLAGIGFVFAGVGAPILLGFITVITAFIPSFGTGIIIFPVVLYLLFTKAYLAGVLLLIWGVVVVGLVDNLLRPYIMHKNLPVHPGIILLSVLGGIALWGPIGLIAGPVCASVGYSLLEIYPLLSKSSN